MSTVKATLATFAALQSRRSTYVRHWPWNGAHAPAKAIELSNTGMELWKGWVGLGRGGLVGWGWRVGVWTKKRGRCGGARARATARIWKLGKGSRCTATPVTTPSSF